MTTHPMTDSKPWYQQFWFWFVFSIPFTAVVVGITLVVISVNHRVELVKDDWSKEGRSINQRFDKQRAAQALGLQAALDYNPEARTFHLRLTSSTDYQPPLLYLELIHPTLGKRDQRLVLSPTPQGDYYAATQTLPQGLYYARLYDENHHWQVDAKLDFDHPIQQYPLLAR